jgi:hypothetical protein
MNNNIDKFKLLPNEIIVIISHYLTDEDLLNLMKTSKYIYEILLPEFEKTFTFGKYLHDFFLAFYISNNENSPILYNTKEYQKFNIRKYCNYDKLQDSSFVISRIGNVWSWQNITLSNTTFKRITCQCESKYCSNRHFIVDVNLRLSLLNIALIVDMWTDFIKHKNGFKNAFEIIKNYKLENYKLENY